MTGLSLYGRLFRYRERKARAPREDFLTEALADLLNRLPRTQLAELLDEVCCVHGMWGAALASARVAWSTQVACDGYFIDLVMSLNSRPAIALESKIYSGIRVHERDNKAGNQLKTYGQWLDRHRSKAMPCALILLTHGTLAPDDFATSPEYGVECRKVFTWASLARWLRRHVAKASDQAWMVLGNELINFLGEHQMSNDTITGADVAAAHLFIPSWSRWSNTFKTMWGAVSDIREGMLGRPSRLQLQHEGGVLWQWAYCVLPRVPPKSWVAFAVRFPDISEWYLKTDLPDHPQILTIIGSDNLDLPVGCVGRPADGWLILENEVVSGRSLHDFPANPDALAEELADWARGRMREALDMLKVMGATSPLEQLTRFERLKSRSGRNRPADQDQHIESDPGPCDKTW